MSSRKDEAAELFNAMPVEIQAAANMAFQAASEVLKNGFGIAVAYDDRAERLVHQIALYMKECTPEADQSALTTDPSADPT
jgi:hypothetical protein